MRKLKLQVQITVDGFVCGLNDELDWMSFSWDDKIAELVNDLTDSSGTIILGRKMTPGFITYWQGTVENPKNPEYEFGRKMIDIPKVVFSKTIKKSEWINTEVANGELKDEIIKLKDMPGKDIVVYGGASFVTSLITEGLIDDYYLFINPVAIGNGKTIFGGVNGKLKLKLIESVQYDCGIVINHYQPQK